MKIKTNIRENCAADDFPSFLPVTSFYAYPIGPEGAPETCGNEKNSGKHGSGKHGSPRPCPSSPSLCLAKNK